MARQPRRGAVTTAGALGVLLLGMAACGDDDGGEPDAGGLATTVAPAEATATTAAGDAAPAGVPIDACALASDDDLARAFPGGAPEPTLTDYGEGFSECEWEEGDALVLVSVVPVENLGADYIDQLNVTGPVDAEELGADAVSFPGLVGIGRASGGGSTVGFTSGEHGVLVAVRTGSGDAEGDLAAATDLAVVVAGNL